MSNGIFDNIIGGGPVIIGGPGPDLPNPDQAINILISDQLNKIGFPSTPENVGKVKDAALTGRDMVETLREVGGDIIENQREGILSQVVTGALPSDVGNIFPVIQAANLANTADNIMKQVDSFAGDIPIVGDVTGELSDFTGDFAKTGQNLILNPTNRGIGFLQNRFLFPALNLFRQGTQPVVDFVRGVDDDDDPPVTVDPSQGIVISQAQDTQPDIDPESITQTFSGTTGGTGGGGGADSSRPDFPTGGGNVVIGGFTPPSTNVQQETQRISDIMDRRRRGSSQGFNAGGLASIPKYLKGR